ncbi:MAG TPA: gluconokinase [Chitinophagaceae bacterium]|nr:gluconokinase [Chitinophagaceae bacterium]
MSVFLGIDIGTTHVKVLAYTSGSGAVLEDKETYALHQPVPGFCEQDPREILAAWEAVMERTFRRLDARQVTAACFSSAYHSILAVDAAGEPITPLITWADTRSEAYARELAESGRAHALFQRTGTPVHPMSPLCKIAWIRDQQPEIFTRARKFLSIKEFIWWQLFGQYEVDYSVASASGLFNLQERTWDTSAMAYCGLDPARLGRPVSVLHARTGPAGRYRQRWNLPADVLFFIGSGDGALANLGSGAIGPGQGALTIGTSGAVRVASQTARLDPAGRLFTYRMTDDWFVQGGAINNGGIALQWFLETLGPPGLSPDSLQVGTLLEELTQVPAGSGGLVFLPYLLGERSPVWDAQARGAFIGLRLGHTRRHLLRAVLEGICFSLRQVTALLEAMGPLHTLHATGGFTQSPFWVQLLADILDKEIRVASEADASAMGAVFLAMRGAGWISDWQQIASLLPAGTLYRPSSGQHARYSENFRVFEHLYEKLQDDFRHLDRSPKKS